MYGLDLLDFIRGRHPWGKFLRLVNGLGRSSRYAAALADDDEYAEQVLALPDRPDRGPALTEFTPEVELLTVLVELAQATNQRLTVLAQQKPDRVRQLPRPRTAFDRVKARRRRDYFDDLLAEVEQARERRAQMSTDREE